MCGRFALYAPLKEIARTYLGTTGPDVEPGPRGNITPGVRIPIIHVDPETGTEPRLSEAHWGFRPPWAGADAPRPINARAEGAATSAFFREAFTQRRCLVPASGWYEWQRTDRGRQPYYITLTDPEPGEILFLAGLWAAAGEDGTERCCAILTEPATRPLAWLHPRQPVALDPACRWAWLDPERTERAAIRAAARRLPPERLAAQPATIAG